MECISFPMRLDATGGLAKHELNSDAQLGEELAVLIATRVGERRMVPSYGVTDFVYTTINDAEVNLKIDLFGPPVVIEKIDTTYPTPTSQDVTVYFESKGKKSSRKSLKRGLSFDESGSRKGTV